MIATTATGRKPRAPTAHELARATTGLALDRRVAHLGPAALPGLTRDPRQMHPAEPTDRTLPAQPAAQPMTAAERDTLCIAALRNRLVARCSQAGVDPAEEVRYLRESAQAFPRLADAYHMAADEVAAWLPAPQERSWVDPEAEAACERLLAHKETLLGRGSTAGVR